MIKSLRLLETIGGLRHDDVQRLVELAMRHKLVTSADPQNIETDVALQAIRYEMTSRFVHGVKFSDQADTVRLMLRLLQAADKAIVAQFQQNQTLEYFYRGEESNHEGFVIVPENASPTEIEAIIGEETVWTMTVSY